MLTRLAILFVSCAAGGAALTHPVGALSGSWWVTDLAARLSHGIISASGTWLGVTLGWEYVRQRWGRSR